MEKKKLIRAAVVENRRSCKTKPVPPEIEGA